MIKNYIKKLLILNSIIGVCVTIYSLIFSEIEHWWRIVLIFILSTHLTILLVFYILRNIPDDDNDGGHRIHIKPNQV